VEYINNELCLGPNKKPLKPLVTDYSRPIYVYDLDFIAQRFNVMQRALPGVKLFYAVKANANIQVLRHLKALGAQADVVSIEEIKRSLAAGFLPHDIVYSGVGKTKLELSESLCLGIYQINVESLPELERIGQIARELGKKAQIALRLNPDIDIKTHPYIATGLKDNKFGIEISMVPALKTCLKSFRDSLELVGVSLHLGSMMLEFTGFYEALIKLKPIYLELKADFPSLNRFDFGGGLGVFYDRLDLAQEENLLKQYSDIVFNVLGDLKCELQSEPGRWLVVHAGVLLTQVQYVKQTSHKKFIITDSGMNHLIRPSLYEARHLIFPLIRREPQIQADVVGPICESADFFAKDIQISIVQEEDFLAVMDVGAYGFSMANNYNLQPLPLEVCI